MNAVDLLATLLAQRGPVIASKYSSLPAYAQLVELGLIEETGVVSSVICNECGQPHDAAVVYEASQYGYHCPDLGFVPKGRIELKAAQPNLGAIASQIADHLNCKRRKSTPVKDDTWRIGSVETHAGHVALYLKPTMQDAQDVHDLKTALTGEIESSFGVVLTFKGDLRLPPLTTVLLQEVLSIEAGKFSFVVDLASIADVPTMRSGGHPNYYRKQLREISALREKEGHTLVGRNEEAKALRQAFKAKFPDRKCPALSTVNRYVSKFRGGS